jgi:hypothetical protein
MYDELRDLAKKAEESGQGEDQYDEYDRELKQGRFLGMTSAQRFVVSLMLLASVVVIGALCLIITGKITVF